MANKRNLKKAIRYACGDMAGQCIIAESVLQGADIEKWDNVILNIAMLQEEAVNRVTVSFDKTPKDFANGRTVRKLFDAVVRKKNSRVIAMGEGGLTKEALTTIEAEDFAFEQGAL